MLTPARLRHELPSLVTLSDVLVFFFFFFFFFLVLIHTLPRVLSVPFGFYTHTQKDYCLSNTNRLDLNPAERGKCDTQLRFLPLGMSGIRSVLVTREIVVRPFESSVGGAFHYFACYSSAFRLSSRIVFLLVSSFFWYCTPRLPHLPTSVPLPLIEDTKFGLFRCKSLTSDTEVYSPTGRLARPGKHVTPHDDHTQRQMVYCGCKVTRNEMEKTRKPLTLEIAEVSPVSH